MQQLIIKFIPPLILLFFPFWLLAQQNVSGHVYDQNSGEALIGVSIFNMEASSGTSTNLYGFYSYEVEKELPIEINISYIGYQDTIVLIEQIQPIDIYLKPIGTAIEEVVVTSSRHQTSQMSISTMTIEDVENLPTFMGEPDIIKAFTLMAGVSASNDNSGGFQVRGGSHDQNLILLDGAKIYNPTHAFDLFSTFNTDAVKQVDLIKGGIPARYGGRLSSVMDVRLREGNLKKFKSKIGLGYLLSSATIEGPIVKDKISFLISGRRTFLDAFNPLISLATNDANTTEKRKIVFGDLTAKTNWIINSKNRIFLSYYGSRDRLKYSENIVQDSFPSQRYEEYKSGDIHWENQLFSFRWNHQFSDKLFSNATLTNSLFNIGVETNLNQQAEISENSIGFCAENAFNSNVKEYGFNYQFDYLPNNQHVIKSGLTLSHYNYRLSQDQKQEFRQGQVIDRNNQNQTQKINSQELNLFAEDEWTINDKWYLNAGIRYSMLLVRKKTFQNLSPRISMAYQIKSNLKLTGSYCRTTQFIHLLTNSNLGIPLDLWVPATDIAEPLRANQFAIGSEFQLKQLGLHFTVETYLKKMDKLIAYKEGASFTDVNTSWEEKIETHGKGNAYGIEMTLQKKQGKTSGWLAYTLAKSNRKFEKLNGGQAYPFKYDKRHDLSLVIMHKKSSRVNFSLAWIYSTGSAFTFPKGTYLTLSDPVLPINANYGVGEFEVLEYQTRNSNRLPAYHRLDLGCNVVKKKKRGFQTWNFSIYNTYVRKNPFLLYLSKEENNQHSIEDFLQQAPVRKLKQVSLFWIIPSVSYHFEFN